MTEETPSPDWHLEERDLDELEYYPENPREITDAEFQGLKNSLRRFGLKPGSLAVSAEHGHVIGGNQRLRAARELGIETAEVAVVEGLSDEEEKALNLALNNAGIQGEFTPDVRDLLDEIRDDDVALWDDLRLFEVEADPDLADDLDEAVEEQDEEEEDDLPPDLELQPFEHYDSVLILVEDARDWNWLREWLELEPRNSSPVGKEQVGLTRAIPVDQFKERLREEGNDLD